MPEVLITIFQSELQKNIFVDNDFYAGARKDGGVDVNATSVEIPQAGAYPTVVRNPSVFPLTIEKRVDDKKTYSIDLFATLPIHVTDVEQAIVSYDKRADILQDHTAYLKENIADNINYVWSPTLAGNIIRTTGAAKPAAAPGATGNRKKITLADFVSAMLKLNAQGAPQQGRRALIPSGMFADLFAIPEFLSADKFGTSILPTGAIGRVLGFDIYTRAKSVVYNNAGTPVPKAIGAATAATDNESALFFHPSLVRYAEGNVKVYAEYDKPTYLGSIFNAAVRSGGVIPRLDQRGVVALVEDAAA